MRTAASSVRFSEADQSLLGDLQEAAQVRRHRADVVDEDVQGSEGQRRPHEVGRAVGGGQVGVDLDHPPVVHQVGEVGARAAGPRDDVGALGRERAGDREPDALAGAGHQCAAALESLVHRRPPPCLDPDPIAPVSATLSGRSLDSSTTAFLESRPRPIPGLSPGVVHGVHSPPRATGCPLGLHDQEMDTAASARDHGIVPEESFGAQVQEHDGRIVVTLRGELDMASEADARLALDEAERRSGGPVLIDLSEVTFMGSNGLRALLESVEGLEAQGRVAELIASTPVEQVISLAGLEHRFTFRVGRVGGDPPDGSRGPDRGVAGPEAG